MKLTNLLHFTENHRFTVSRDFALSGLSYKMLAGMYQPMVGAGAVSLYHTLYQQLPGDKVGYSPFEQQRRLFLQLELEPGEKGRKQFIEWSSKLEAVGLLSTNRRLVPDTEEYLYEYQLYEPLPPGEFFRNQHLTLLLRDKVGKYMLLLLREELLSGEPAELRDSVSEQLSVPFYELFRLNTQVVDYELEQALYESAAGRQQGGALDTESQGFHHAEILTRIPKSSRHRTFIEALQFRKEHLAAINIAAKKYGLTLQETCRLLDEDGVFDEEGNLLFEVLQYRAGLLYRQGKRREDQNGIKLKKLAAAASEQDGSGGAEPEEEKGVQMEFYLEVPPIFQGQCDIHQYNMILRNQPYTLVLKKFFPATVPDGLLDLFERIDLSYGLSEEVINVLIHFLHVNRRSWSKAYIEAIVTDMLGKQVGTYEQAVDYIREMLRYRAGATAGGGKRTENGSAAGGRAGGSGSARGPRSTGGSGRGGKQQKPVIPVVTDKPGRKTLSEEEMEAIIRKASKWEEGKS
ncbi:DnaD domain protein [Gorillibacterium sp. sgz5001074]|uniref:DnaD domain protein n=1 Tax=Gorillibacterium sp. sgz5001074 TaxID=3446695 RepID=UPI003F681318